MDRSRLRLQLFEEISWMRLTPSTPSYNSVARYCKVLLNFAAVPLQVEIFSEVMGACAWEKPAAAKARLCKEFHRFQAFKGNWGCASVTPNITHRFHRGLSHRLSFNVPREAFQLFQQLRDGRLQPTERWDMSTRSGLNHKSQNTSLQETFWRPFEYRISLPKVDSGDHLHSGDQGRHKLRSAICVSIVSVFAPGVWDMQRVESSCGLLAGDERRWPYTKQRLGYQRIQNGILVSRTPWGPKSFCL